MNEQDLKLAEIFHPYYCQRRRFVQEKNIRFVHYTRAESAMRILQTKQVWLRKTNCLNDFTEVEHGLQCLFNSYEASSFRSSLDGIFPGIDAEVVALFDRLTPQFRYESYLTCFSEHDDSEDFLGRLSMWRAYGSGTGVALVMNNAPFFGTSNALNVYSSPVAYYTDKEVAQSLEEISKSIAVNSEIIRGIGRENVKGWVFNMLKIAALCTKHPGFQEEREWRVVYSPTLGSSPHILRDIENVGGVPQPVHKIPLQNLPEEGFTAAIPNLIDRIIIGPTEYPSAIRDAFIQLLFEAGLEDAIHRVAVSQIPLRRGA